MKKRLMRLEAINFYDDKTKRKANQAFLRLKSADQFKRR
jgi:hypothetical protein